MLIFEKKVNYLLEALNNKEHNYADSFKDDILMFIGDFTQSNPNLFFLKRIDSKEGIINWVNRLTSRIVLKFDDEAETIGDFIYDYIVNG